MNMACLAMIILVMTTVVADARAAPPLSTVSAEARALFSFSSPSLVTLKEQGRDLPSQTTIPDVIEEDYGSSKPTPPFGGQKGAPIPHAQV